VNVYLAGKVDERLGEWREWIVGRQYHYPTRQSIPRWIKPSLDNLALELWVPIPRAVFGSHAYAGPFRQVIYREIDNKYLGYFHGVTTHGQHGDAYPERKEQIIAACRRAIEQSDLIFAYLNSPDAYGTIAEIGYAVALGKFVSILIQPGTAFDYDDFWFVESLCHQADLTWWDHPKGDERMRVTGALKNAFVAYSAWQPEPALPARQQDAHSLALREVADSFQQISQWTSDPRVRGEAQQMLKRLYAR